MVDCLGDGGGGVGGEGGSGSGRRKEGEEGVVDYCCPFGLCEGWHYYYLGVFGTNGWLGRGGLGGDS